MYLDLGSLKSRYITFQNILCIYSTYIHNLVVNSDLNMSMIHFTNIEMLCCCGIPETESNSTRLYGCFCAFRSMSKVTVPDSKQNENRNQPMIVVTNTC